MKLIESEKNLIKKLLENYSYTQLLLSDRFKNSGDIAEHYDVQKESDDAIELINKIMQD